MRDGDIRDDGARAPFVGDADACLRPQAPILLLPRPLLLTGTGINSASVDYDSTQSAWAVDLHWGNDDVLKKIARPLINKEVAIVLDGLVVSAPVINPGITGRDVEITGAIGRAEAINVAASIMGIAPSQVRIDTSG